MFIIPRGGLEVDANLIDFNCIIFIYKNRRGGAGGGFLEGKGVSQLKLLVFVRK